MKRLALLTTVVFAFAAPIADAHVQVKSTSPKTGAKTSVDSASVTYSGPIRSGTLTVSGPGGTASKGKGGRDPRNINRVLVALKSGLKAGTYTAKWTCVAADGHKESGSFKFKLKK